MKKIYPINVKLKLCVILSFLLVSVCQMMAETKNVTIGDFNYSIDTETKEAAVKENGMGHYSGDVVVPGNITVDNVDYTVVEIKNNVFWYSSAMNSVQLPNSIRKIGNYCFTSCSNLQKVNLSNTSLQIIPKACFDGCSNLREVKLPVSVTKLEASSFYNCEKLTSINIPTGVSELGNQCFYGCN